MYRKVLVPLTHGEVAQPANCSSATPGIRQGVQSDRDWGSKPYDASLAPTSRGNIKEASPFPRILRRGARGTHVAGQDIKAANPDTY